MDLLLSWAWLLNWPCDYSTCIYTSMLGKLVPQLEYQPQYPLLVAPHQHDIGGWGARPGRLGPSLMLGAPRGNQLLHLPLYMSIGPLVFGRIYHSIHWPSPWFHTSDHLFISFSIQHWLIHSLSTAWITHSATWIHINIPQFNCRSSRSLEILSFWSWLWAWWECHSFLYITFSSILFICCWEGQGDRIM